MALVPLIPRLWLLIAAMLVLGIAAGTVDVGGNTLFFFLYVGAEVGFGGWIFTYAVALDLGSETAAAYLTSAFWGALTFGRLLTIPHRGPLHSAIYPADQPGGMPGQCGRHTAVAGLANSRLGGHAWTGPFDGSDLPHHPLLGRTILEDHGSGDWPVFRRGQRGRYVVALVDWAALRTLWPASDDGRHHGRPGYSCGCPLHVALFFEPIHSERGMRHDLRLRIWSLEFGI